jgi:site-specific recombinase XerD
MGALDDDALRRYRDRLEAIGRLHHRCGSHTEEAMAAQHLLAFWREKGVAGAASRPPAGPPALAEFGRWMTVHRGVRPTTLKGYGYVIRDLLTTLGENRESYAAGPLRAFVLARATQHGMAKAKAIVTAVRMFLRFCSATGRCRPGLDAAIPVLAHWRLASVPRHLSAGDVERLIGSCEGRTVTALRDKAILLLLARLGLRAGDVAAVTFQDIDWEHGTLRVAGKSRQAVRLPLPQAVGDAILAYLDGERPRVPCAQVFMKAVAPYRPMASELVSSVVRRAVVRAGVDAPSRGAHLLRHSAATAMLRDGASLQEIAAILRHASIETTQQYAKVDRDLLAMVVAPWPGPPAGVTPDARVTAADVQALAIPWPEVQPC